MALGLALGLALLPNPNQMEPKKALTPHPPHPHPAPPAPRSTRTSPIYHPYQVEPKKGFTSPQQRQLDAYTYYLDVGRSVCCRASLNLGLTRTLTLPYFRPNPL